MLEKKREADPVVAAVPCPTFQYCPLLFWTLFLEPDDFRLDLSLYTCVRVWVRVLVQVPSVCMIWHSSHLPSAQLIM